MWSVLAALFPMKTHREELSNYIQFENEVDWTGISFPTPLHQIRTFEKNNSNITVNVYQWEPKENNAVIPVYLTRHQKRDKHIDLLLLSTSEASHFCWIRKMCRLVAHRSKHHGATFVCPHCINPFTHIDNFKAHFPDCSRHVRQQVLYPPLDKCFLQWRARGKRQLANHIIYADFESYLAPVKYTDPVTGKTVVIDEHRPSEWCAYTVSQEPDIPNKLMSYSGEECMPEFYKYMMEEQKRIASIEGQNIAMLPLSKHQREKYEKAESCKSCSKPFTKKNYKVRHHAHSSGNFIGAVCNACNLQLKGRRRYGKKITK